MVKKGTTHRYVLEKKSSLAAIPNMPYDLLVMGTAGANTKSVRKKYSTVTFKVFTPIERILSNFQCCIV